MLGKDGMALVAILFVLRFAHIEMVTPTGQFQAFITEGLGLLRDGIQGEVGPLDGK